MTEAHRKRRRASLLAAFAARPRLVWALLVGLAVFAGLRLATTLDWFVAAILGWDACCVALLALATRFMSGANTPEAIRLKAATQDEGQAVALGLAVAAALASITAVGLELSVIGHQHGLEKGLRVSLALATVALSWAFVQFVFALHYAHEYYGPAALARSPEGHGLAFPGDEPPDYWDFLHFSMVIGVACQTADVAFTSKPLRRIGGLHGVLAFVFNTGVVALAVSLLTGLFGPGA